MQIPPLPHDAENLTAALTYAKAGLYLLPIKPGTKHPGSRVGKDWGHKSSTNAEQLIAWFAGSDDGIAVDLGRSGLLALDIDHPELVPQWLAETLDCAAAPYQSSRPDQVQRGHHFFIQPEGRRIGNGRGQLAGMGLDIRGAGGVVIMAPSRHAEGGHYQWMRIGDIPLLPSDIADKLRDTDEHDSAATETEVSTFVAEHIGQARPAALETWPAKFKNEVSAGNSRHETMVSLLPAALEEARAGYFEAAEIVERLRDCFIGAMLQDSGGRKMSATSARSEFDTILAWSVAQAKTTPLATIRQRVETNLQGSFNSAPPPPIAPIPENAAAGQPEANTAAIRDVGAIHSRLASDIKSAVPDWAWTYDGYGRIQRGTLCIMAGRPGAGKSNAARWFAAGYSNGTISGCWYNQPVNVAYISPGEESHAYVIKPGLDAVGADTGKIAFPTVFDDENNPTRLLVAAHRDKLINWLKENKIRVVIVDPIMSTIPGSTNINQNNETRQHVEPWAHIAEAIDGIVIGICHFTKYPGGDLVAAINGSSAFGEVARSIFGFVKDRKTGQRVMSQVKNSTGMEDLSLLYEVATAFVPTDLGGEASVAAFNILGKSELTAADMMEASADGELDFGGPNLAELWLKDYLTGKQRTPAMEVVREAKSQNDISRATLYRAAKSLGVISFHEGFPRKAYWRLRLLADEADAQSYPQQYQS